MACSSGRPALGTDPGGLKQQDRIHDKRPLIQLTLDGQVVAEYLSIAHASRALNISRRSISCAMTGAQKTAGGYKWVEKETPETKEKE